MVSGKSLPKNEAGPKAAEAALRPRGVLALFVTALLFMAAGAFLSGCSAASTPSPGFNATQNVTENPKPVHVTPSGCDYDNPACDSSHSCMNNTCVQKGCAYGNPPCGSNSSCVDNACVLKEGCSYNNPPCGANQSCLKLIGRCVGSAVYLPECDYVKSDLGFGDAACKGNAIVYYSSSQFSKNLAEYYLNDAINCREKVMGEYGGFPGPAGTEFQVDLTSYSSDSAGAIVSATSNGWRVNMDSKAYATVSANLQQKIADAENGACENLEPTVQTYTGELPMPYWLGWGLIDYTKVAVNGMAAPDCKETAAFDAKKGYCFWDYAKQKYGPEGVLRIVQALKDNYGKTEDEVNFFDDIVKPAIGEDISQNMAAAYHFPLVSASICSAATSDRDTSEGCMKLKALRERNASLCTGISDAGTRAQCIYASTSSFWDCDTPDPRGYTTYKASCFARFGAAQNNMKICDLLPAGDGSRAVCLRDLVKLTHNDTLCDSLSDRVPCIISARQNYTAITARAEPISIPTPPKPAPTPQKIAPPTKYGGTIVYTGGSVSSNGYAAKLIDIGLNDNLGYKPAIGYYPATFQIFDPSGSMIESGQTIRADASAEDGRPITFDADGGTLNLYVYRTNPSNDSSQSWAEVKLEFVSATSTKTPETVPTPTTPTGGAGGDTITLDTAGSYAYSFATGSYYGSAITADVNDARKHGADIAVWNTCRKTADETLSLCGSISFMGGTTDLGKITSIPADYGWPSSSGPTVFDGCVSMKVGEAHVGKTNDGKYYKFQVISDAYGPGASAASCNHKVQIKYVYPFSG